MATSWQTGSLGAFHLKRLWSAAMLARRGCAAERPDEEMLDKLVLNALGVGLHQAYEYLYQSAPSFADFEDWIVATGGRPDPVQVERLNADIARKPQPPRARKALAEIEGHPQVLTDSELAFWQEHGYVVLRGAVDAEASAAAADAIWARVGADPDDPNSWYGRSDHGIMVELIQHPALAANRRSRRIHKAFAQLWETADLWVTADRCGFHPPQRPDAPFPGPDLHWDVDLTRPLRFGTQGILYLTDTPDDQGALTLVPGFQHRLALWLESLESGADPQQQDLHALGSRPIGAEAGDMVIWHQLLPHGSRPNLGARPRIVQYINMVPGLRSSAQAL